MWFLIIIFWALSGCYGLYNSWDYYQSKHSKITVKWLLNVCWLPAIILIMIIYSGVALWNKSLRLEVKSIFTTLWWDGHY